MSFIYRSKLRISRLSRSSKCQCLLLVLPGQCCLHLFVLAVQRHLLFPVLRLELLLEQNNLDILVLRSRSLLSDSHRDLIRDHLILHRCSILQRSNLRILYRQRLLSLLLFRRKRLIHLKTVLLRFLVQLVVLLILLRQRVLMLCIRLRQNLLILKILPRLRELHLARHPVKKLLLLHRHRVLHDLFLYLICNRIVRIRIQRKLCPTLRAANHHLFFHNAYLSHHKIILFTYTAAPHRLSLYRCLSRT